jgi:serine/threonine protein kinase
LNNIKGKPINFLATPIRSKEAIDLISHMLDKDEEKRYSWKQVKEHPFI